MRRRPGVAAALALAWVAAGCGGEPAVTPPNVLVIVFDTARADAFSANGRRDARTPVFDRTAAAGVLFANARSTSAWTLPAHGSLFTGLYPSRHGAHHESQLLAEDLETMAELLAETHDTGAFSENPHIVRAKGFAQGFDRFDETWRLRGERGEVPPTVDLVLEWLEDRDDPFFLFVNLMDPHLPYVPPESFEKLFLPPGADARRVARLRGVSEREARLFIAERLRFEPQELAILRALYGAEVAFADARAGQILDALEERGLLERTLVVLLSDHGENIGEHGLMEHQLCLYETLLRVPLVLRLPGVFDGGNRRNDPVQLVDVLPTVLEVAGVPRDRWPELESLSLAAGPIPSTRPLYAEYMRPIRQRAHFAAVAPGFDFDRFDRRLKSVQIGPQKLIESDRGEVELYDLGADPAETRDLAEDRPEVVERMRAVLERFARGARARAPGPEPELDPETRGALRELGYVE
jgi:arylsulfatase A-like enzyme